MMATGGRTKVLGTNTYLYSIPFYDEKGRVIQTQSTNITGGIDVNTTQYSWVGQPLVMVQKIQNLTGTLNETVTVTQMSYDDLGRVLKTEKKLSNSLVNNNAMSAYKTIAENKYDKLGQLINKTIGNKATTSAPLAKLDYEYNIRGWLTAVNKNFVTAATTAGNADDRYFGMQLGYDKDGFGAFAKKAFNGNISGSIWRSAGDGVDRKYDYDYDAANRLLKADFTQYEGSAFVQSTTTNFNVKMGDGVEVNSAYDYNGNIKQMQQWGLKINASPQIDNLTYLYSPNSNTLIKVSDEGITATDNGKLGDFKDGSNSNDDYTYDVNGNMNLDNNKGIGNIVYNHLNLPSLITIPNKGTIAYTYDAIGNKFKKVTQENPNTANNNKTITTTTLYVNGLQYESKITSPANTPNNDYTNVLQFVPQEEGRIRFKPALQSIAASFEYDYMLKDHLGNVRMVITDEVQQDIYPVATLESNLISLENAFYTTNSSNIVANSVANYLRDANGNAQIYKNNNQPIINNNTNCGTANLCTIDNSAFVYKLDGSHSNKMGLGITLKVMAGDRIDVYGKSYWYQNPTGPPPSNGLPILDILTGFLGGTTGVGATNVHGEVQASQINPGTNNVAINSFFDTQTNQSTPLINNPKAFINVIFFDEQFNAIDYKVSMVGENKVLKDHIQDLQNLIASKSGFVYIYCSNESPVNVFFDNLQLVHTRGAILDETHYYPFGLVMSGISSKAAGSLANKYKWNSSSELNTDFNLNLYETFYRSLDPQIGRFHQSDPKIEKQENSSPYESMGNNPISNIDPLGDFKTQFGAWLHKLFHGGGKIDQNKFGEWFVNKTRSIEIDNNGGIIATSFRFYGEGRRAIFSGFGNGGQRLGNWGTTFMPTGGQQSSNINLFQGGEGWGFRTPEFTARIGVGAGGGVSFPKPGGSLQYFSRKASFIGLRNNNFEVGNKMYSPQGKYLGTYENSIWESGFIAHASHESEKFTSSDGNVQITDTRTFTLGIFESEKKTDITSQFFQTTTTTYSFNFSYLMGIGLFIEGGVKLPFYQKIN